MIDKKTLDDAFETIKRTEESILNARKIVYAAAESLILGVLRLYEKEYHWPGMNTTEVTKKINKYLDNRFTKSDIQSVMLQMEELGKIECNRSNSNFGYRLPPFEKKSIILPFEVKFG